MPGSPDTSTARARALYRLLPRRDQTLDVFGAARERKCGVDVDARREWDLGFTGRRDVPRHLARGQRGGQALQVELAQRSQLEVGARAGQHAHDVAHEDLPAVRRGAEARRLDDRCTEPVAVLERRVAALIPTRIARRVSPSLRL